LKECKGSRNYGFIFEVNLVAVSHQSHTRDRKKDRKRLGPMDIMKVKFALQTNRKVETNEIISTLKKKDYEKWLWIFFALNSC